MEFIYAFLVIFVVIILLIVIFGKASLEKIDTEKVLGLIKTLSSEEERMKVLKRNHYNENLCYDSLNYIKKDENLMLIAKHNDYNHYILMDMIWRLEDDDNIVTVLLEHKRKYSNDSGYWSLVEKSLREFKFGKNKESYRNELIKKMGNCKLFEEKMGEFFEKWADVSWNCLPEPEEFIPNRTGTYV